METNQRQVSVLDRHLKVLPKREPDGPLRGPHADTFVVGDRKIVAQRCPHQTKALNSHGPKFFFIRAVGRTATGSSLTMYDQSDLLGGSLGLPPHTVRARARRVAGALGNHVNVAGHSPPAGEVVGHCSRPPTSRAPREGDLCAPGIAGRRRNGPDEGGSGWGRRRSAACGA
jgi:hypothetical protein